MPARMMAEMVMMEDISCMVMERRLKEHGITGARDHGNKAIHDFRFQMVGELRLVSCSPRLRKGKSNYNIRLSEAGRTMGFGIKNNLFRACSNCSQMMQLLLKN